MLAITPSHAHGGGFEYVLWGIVLACFVGLLVLARSGGK